MSLWKIAAGIAAVGAAAAVYALTRPTREVVGKWETITTFMQILRPSSLTYFVNEVAVDNTHPAVAVFGKPPIEHGVSLTNKSSMIGTDVNASWHFASVPESQYIRIVGVDWNATVTLYVLTIKGVSNLDIIDSALARAAGLEQSADTIIAGLVDSEMRRVVAQSAANLLSNS